MSFTISKNKLLLGGKFGTKVALNIELAYFGRKILPSKKKTMTLISWFRKEIFLKRLQYRNHKKTKSKMADGIHLYQSIL